MSHKPGSELISFAVRRPAACVTGVANALPESGFTMIDDLQN